MHKIFSSTVPINLTDSGVALAGSENYMLYCNAESPTPANFTSFSWSNSQGIVTSNDRINITLLNATFDTNNNVFVFNSTLQFQTLAPSDADIWTCSITLNLTLAEINYINSSSIPLAIEGQFKKIYNVNKRHVNYHVPPILQLIDPSFYLTLLEIL